jgi:hypothetical protein
MFEFYITAPQLCQSPHPGVSAVICMLMHLEVHLAQACTGLHPVTDAAGCISAQLLLYAPEYATVSIHLVASLSLSCNVC